MTPTELERRIARLEQLTAAVARRADRVESDLGGVSQTFALGTSWLYDSGQASCAYEDLPTTLSWTQATAAGLSLTTTLTKLADFAAIMDTSDADLAVLDGVRGWAGSFEPSQIGRGTAYRVVWEVSPRVFKIDHCFGGLTVHDPYLWDGNTPATNLGRENLSTTKTCSAVSSPRFQLTATSAYFGAITVTS